MLAFFFLSVASSITDLRAQGLSVDYLDSVRQFFHCDAFINWMQTGYSGQRNNHPVIVRQPILHPNPSVDQHNSFRAIFAKKNHTVIYHWTSKVRKSVMDTILVKTDSLVLTETEKMSIMNSQIDLSISDFAWTNDYFPGATFPIQSPDSLFTRSVQTPNGVYVLSMPVFLRNYSYCVFNYAWVINGGGRYSYQVYKKTKGQKWYRYGEFGGGDW